MLDRLRPLAAVIALAIPAVLPPAPATADGFTVIDDVVQIRLLPGWRDGTGRHMAALRIDLAPGWKTYWRSPGEGGIPPLFDWSRSDNLREVALHWPTPHAFEQLGLTSIGYRDRLILPIEVTPARPGAPITLDAALTIGVCQDICLPVERDLRVTLPANGGAPDPLIRAALADRPLTAAEAGLTGLACALNPMPDGVRISARLDLPPGPGREAVVFEPADPGIWVSDAVVRREGSHLTANAEMVPETAVPIMIDRSRLRVTVIGQDRAVTATGCPAP